jgi:hypothetical protein
LPLSLIIALRDLPEGVEIANILFSRSNAIILFLFSPLEMLFMGRKTSFDNEISKGMCS